MDKDAINKEYIDIEDALKRIGGNEGLYKKLLTRFIEGNYLDLLCAAIDNGDMEEAARAAHTLKGVSANLSLVKVQSVSTELEHAIKEGQDHTGKLDELKQAADATMEQITGIMNQG